MLDKLDMMASYSTHIQVDVSYPHHTDRGDVDAEFGAVAADFRGRWEHSQFHQCVGEVGTVSGYVEIGIEGVVFTDASRGLNVEW
jgi:hypothetical protein